MAPEEGWQGGDGSALSTDRTIRQPTRARPTTGLSLAPSNMALSSSQINAERVRSLSWTKAGETGPCERVPCLEVGVICDLFWGWGATRSARRASNSAAVRLAECCLPA